MVLFSYKDDMLRGVIVVVKMDDKKTLYFVCSLFTCVESMLKLYIHIAVRGVGFFFFFNADFSRLKKKNFSLRIYPLFIKKKKPIGQMMITMSLTMEGM